MNLKVGHDHFYENDNRQLKQLALPRVLRNDILQSFLNDLGHFSDTKYFGLSDYIIIFQK